MAVTTNAPLTGLWQLALSTPGGTVTLTEEGEWAITDTAAEPGNAVVKGHVLPADTDKDFILGTGERVYIRCNSKGTLVTTPTTGV